MTQTTAQTPAPAREARTEIVVASGPLLHYPGLELVEAVFHYCENDSAHLLTLVAGCGLLAGLPLDFCVEDLEYGTVRPSTIMMQQDLVLLLLNAVIVRKNGPVDTSSDQKDVGDRNLYCSG